MGTLVTKFITVPIDTMAKMITNFTSVYMVHIITMTQSVDTQLLLLRIEEQLHVSAGQRHHQAVCIRKCQK